MNLFSDNFNIDSLDVAKKLFEESRSGFMKLFHNSPVCMSMTTPERKYVRVNQKFLEKFGFTEEEIIGRNSAQIGILDAEESARVGNIIKEKGRLHNDYVKCRAKNGQYVHTISSIELMEMSGETYLIAFFQDITKVIEQQTIIEQQMQHLETVNRELEAFSYSVSHDLRAPLRTIRGYSQILEEDFSANLPTNAKEILDTMKRDATRMENLIEGLLQFSQSGEKMLSKQQLDMESMVKEIYERIGESAPHKATLKLHPLPKANGDYVLMTQVLTNLISNALKYSSKKTKPEIEIGAETSGNEIIYYVKDNGAGFDMKYAEKLFSVFQRLHNREEYEGTGIGLSLVARIITRHGGRIWAEAKEFEGATFYFALPV